MRHDQSSNDYHTAHITNIYFLHSYQSLLAIPLKGRDTPADCPRNELEEEEETVQTRQYSQDQDHQSGTALGIGSVVRVSYGGRGGRAQVVDPSRKSRGRRTTVVQRSLQSVVKESRRRRAV